jgi:hypothetical protein
MRQGLLGIAAVGLAIGTLQSLGAAKGVAGALSGVSFVDPVAWFTATATLLGVASPST